MWLLLLLPLLSPALRGEAELRGGPSRTDGYWDAIREQVEDSMTWSGAKPAPQGLDATKDPCLLVRCPPHRVCISHDYQTATCASPTQLEHSAKARGGGVAHKHKPEAAAAHGRCRPCPVLPAAPVCGSDGHVYSSQCKMDLRGCLAGKELWVRCVGPCPCLPPARTPRPAVCSDADLHSLASRLQRWFGGLHLDASRDLQASQRSDRAPARFDTSILPICKDSLGWMFNQLDVNFDLLLDPWELSPVYRDREERCTEPLLNSCDSFKDGRLSNNEWCYCFQKPEGMPCQNQKNKIQLQGPRKNLTGAYLPRCTAVGYFRPTQCHGSVGQCWCVDKYGNELPGSRRQGQPHCGEDPETSGDLGSGGGVVLLGDKEGEEPSLSGRGRQKKRRGRIHPRGTMEDDEDREEEEEKEEEDETMGYVW